MTDLIPANELYFFRKRQRDRLYALFVGRFSDLERQGLMTRDQLAYRLNRRRRELDRLLTSARDWELNTISDLALALDHCELKFVLKTNSARSSPRLNAKGSRKPLLSLRG